MLCIFYFVFECDLILVEGFVFLALLEHFCFFALNCVLCAISLKIGYTNLLKINESFKLF